MWLNGDFSCVYIAQKGGLANYPRGEMEIGEYTRSAWSHSCSSSLPKAKMNDEFVVVAKISGGLCVEYICVVCGYG